MTKESIIILVADIHYLYHRAGKVLEGDDADNATSILWKTQAALSALAAERDAANEKLAAARVVLDGISIMAKNASSYGVAGSPEDGYWRIRSEANEGILRIDVGPRPESIHPSLGVKARNDALLEALAAIVYRRRCYESDTVDAFVSELYADIEAIRANTGDGNGR